MSETAKKQKNSKEKAALAVVPKESGKMNSYKENIHKMVKNLKNKEGLLGSDEIMDIMLEKGFTSEEEIARAFSKEYEVEFIENLVDYQISEDVLKIISRKTCEKYTIIPLIKMEKTLVVAFADPSDMHIRDTLSLMTDLKIQPVVATKGAIKKMFNKYFDRQKEVDSLFYDLDMVMSVEAQDDNVIDLNKKQKKSDPVIVFVNLVFSDAVYLGASDIHIEPYEKTIRIRYRVDGLLHEKHVLPKETAGALISRVKVISNMDISEKRKPQDARLKVFFEKKEINMRVSTLPTVSGEKIVLRILDDSAVKKGISSLGMEEEQKKLFLDTLHQPQGMVLMTGPTGSGKTTTIYSGLVKVNTPDCNISTVEDPVEFRIHGINQIQVNHKVGLDFSAALRSFLRQDPDVILVGEIRDLETAEIAYKASATGHMVLSTLHTNDTVSTVGRLLNMGVPSYSVAENTSLIIAQRLLRRVCVRCRQKAEITDQILMEAGVSEEDLDLYSGKVYEKGKGCKDCDGLGYKGRVAIYEMLPITGNIKKCLFAGVSQLELKSVAIQKDGLKTLRQSALLKLQAGLVSIDEVIRGTLGDDGV
ncbi:MAG: ATPase, T2SS/T4P/T4SS family [Bdellovibrionales bacterium]|nr:ATPase, T2SS/T4P/T4SS family [Bdellovibrionales bacterium]